MRKVSSTEQQATACSVNQSSGSHLDCTQRPSCGQPLPLKILPWHLLTDLLLTLIMETFWLQLKEFTLAYLVFVQIFNYFDILLRYYLYYKDMQIQFSRY